MLDALRTATKGFVGRSLMTIVLGLIIVSFAIWGIGDIFRGVRSGDLAKVGNTQISVDAYRSAYQAELQRLQRMARRPITNEEARLLGIDDQILQRLIGNAALDQEARALGLGLADDEVTKQIAKDPMFRGASGKFDPKRLEAILRDNGLTQHGYLAEQRAQALRGEIVDALTHGLDVPKAMLAAIHRFQSERRTIDFIVVPTSAAGTVPAPTEEELKKFFEDRQELYGVPEYRSFVTVLVTPASLAKPDAVAEADVMKRYEEVKTDRYGTPERRAVDQIVFADEATARAARASLDAGRTFDEVLAEKNIAPTDASLGTLPKGAFADKNVAEAAFALPKGGVSAPIATPFGTILVRVREIEPSTVKPFSEVAAEMRREIAVQRARTEVSRIHDEIEDRRAAGKSLDEAVEGLGLEPRKVGSIDPFGNDIQNRPVEDIAADASLMKAIFASDVGVDNETLRTRDGGYRWFEVTGITPARQKGFGEVKPEVEKAWRDDEIAKRMSAKVAGLVEKLQSGASIASIAAAEGNLEVQHAANLQRSGGEGPAAKAASQAFNVGIDGAGSAELDDGGRVVFRVVAVDLPPFDPADPAVSGVAGQVKQVIVEDVVAQHLGKLEAELGVKVSERAREAATGNATDLF
jgi:peptidyl-prolyl cis-trans isomerase D